MSERSSGPSNTAANEQDTKLVMFHIVARVPADFFEESQVYGLDTRAGWVDDILTYNGLTVPRDDA